MLDFEYAKALAEVVLDTTCSKKESHVFFAGRRTEAYLSACL